MQSQEVMVPYPPDVIAEIDKPVDRGTRTDFLVELARREIKLRRQMEALRATTGAWNPDDHPELADGAARRVREIREESKRRYEEIEQNRES
jgi:hypothetical protein